MGAKILVCDSNNITLLQHRNWV